MIKIEKRNKSNGLKIAVDISPLKQENLSGVGRYLQEVLSRLLILDQDNEYFLISFGRKNKDIKVDLSKFKNVHFIHHNIPSKLVFLTSFLFSWPRIKVDIFWLANFNIYNLVSKTKLITTIHDLSFRKYPQFFNFKRRLWHFLVRPLKTIRKSYKLITVSKNTALDLQNQYNISRDKIIVSSLGISSRYKVINDEVKLEKIKLKYNLADNFILFLGTREPRKNLLAILKAFQKIEKDRLELVIVGGRGWKEIFWKKYYQTLNDDLKKRIKILNYISEKDLSSLYNLAKVFVWPSFYEGFGLPVCEALACNCPVITSNNSSLPELVQNNALLIDAFNVNDLYQALGQLLDDEELYSFYKNKKFNQEYYYNWNEAAEKLLKLFKKI
ncbi:glycosyltransferase family 4 protein [bacterium]|nr:glycosyltransferase family 4 protein [bacterium]